MYLQNRQKEQERPGPGVEPGLCDSTRSLRGHYQLVLTRLILSGFSQKLFTSENSLRHFASFIDGFYVL